MGPVAGGFARRLGLHGRYPAWSPDGTKIAYCNGDGLYVAGSDGSNARSLATLPGEPMYPRWSPDGRVIRITVVNANASTNSLWEVGADGTSNAHVILPGWSKHPHEAFGAWTPDGKYFVFQSRQDGSTDIWAIREKCGVFRRNCGVPVRLTQGPLSYSQPLPSRDGKKLFVLSEEKHPELFRYDLKSKELLSYPFKTPITEIEYSRDVRRVAYVTYPGYILWCTRRTAARVAN